MEPAVVLSYPSPGCALVTLGRPRQRNAMSEELTAAWTAVLAELTRQRELRAVVVTGQGSAFCAGGDLGWIAAGSPEDVDVESLRARMIPFYRAWLAVRELPVPVIAALNGPAVGAGLCLALACDLRYAAPSASLSAPFAFLGMHPAMAATFLLPEVAGLPLARELLYTGRVLSAAEAAAAGLVNAVVGEAELLAHALGVAARVADAAPLAVRLTKAGLAQAPRSYAEALAWEGLAQPVTLASRDLREGLAARAEHRTPRFDGR